LPYTVSKVLDSNPDALSTAADEAGACAKRVGENMATERKHLENLAEDWTGGTAAESAQKQGTDMLTDQAAYQKKLLGLKTALTSGAQKLRDSRSELQTAVDDAEVWWNVADNGSVTPGWALATWAALSKVNWFEVENKRIAIEQRITLILAQFEAADEAIAYEVRKLGWS
jgi:hypothetical protein